MQIGMYDSSGELAVVLPADRFCGLMEIGRNALNDVLEGKRKGPKGLIVVKLPDSIAQRMPPLKLQKWRELWKR